ncbi:MAG: alanine--tRNA ligase [Deltaproteobacteria bacterium]|nr:alanine--tRNA ligase [Deltaproteobacteria bacterium]
MRRSALLGGRGRCYISVRGSTAMISGNDVRQRFLQFFQRADHCVVPSSSLVPDNDPTLYFTNAGMVQFKDVFVGLQTRDFNCATTSQKCLRVTGKHNDLEAVGRTTRHHTFFEMLGNFSFGDYFKEGAIKHAWRFLTEEVGIDGDRIMVSIFGGDDEVPADDQAFAVWHEVIGLPERRIQRLGKADNFWAMGDSGPCGPCTELHVPHGDTIPDPQDLEAWLEVWNLVFMQFNRQDGQLSPLERTGVDTGMGLERLAMVLQGKPSTFDTDLIFPLIDAVAERSGIPYGKNADNDTSMRVLADHARATAFCIADGVFPDKGGREYVLRRIMRRAIRHGTLLGLEDNFFAGICGRVVDMLGSAYPDLPLRRETIEKVVDAEESAFRRTLSRGTQRLSQAIEKAKGAGDAALSAEFVGDLCATYGFPIDLTRLIAEDAQLSVDEDAAREWIEKTHGSAETKVGDKAIDPLYKALAEELPETQFTGYGSEAGEAQIIGLLLVGEDGAVRRVDQATAPARVDLYLDATPFYARGGGQIGDQGTIDSKHGASATLEVQDTTKPTGAHFVHSCLLKQGTIKVGQSVVATVDRGRRQAIRSNHSATHLLHHALRRVLGPHVAQKGSEVSAERLRFDFSHFEAMSKEQLAIVEDQINEQIRANVPSRTEEMAIDEARSAGAMSLFGEKYGDVVRVVRIGEQSIELCGGTHVGRSGDIGLCRIVAEEPLALGVRRIVGLTGAAALAYDRERAALLEAAARALKVGPEQLLERVERLQAQLRQSDKELAEARRALASGANERDPLAAVVEVSGVKLLATRVAVGDPKTLRDAGDSLRDRLGSGIVVLGGEHEGKATLLVMVSKDLTKQFHAGKLVGKLAEIVDGRGGGRPDMAQAGGPSAAKLDAALAAAAELLSA